MPTDTDIDIERADSLAVMKRIKGLEKALRDAKKERVYYRDSARECSFEAGYFADECKALDGELEQARQALDRIGAIIGTVMDGSPFGNRVLSFDEAEEIRHLIRIGKGEP